MFANQGESLHLPALQVNFAPVGYLCDRERERRLCLPGGVTLVCPLFAVLSLSPGHVDESQIIRSELRWAGAGRN